MAAAGFNPIRWNCRQRGACFNRVHRPKIEVFAECFPGKIALTDIDSAVEINGHFLVMEFKSGMPRDLPVGQRIMFERLTALSTNIVVVIVCADAETMVVRALNVIFHGKVQGWEIATLEHLKNRIERWVDRVSATRRAAA